MIRDVCSADIRLVEPTKMNPSQTKTGSQYFRKAFIEISEGRDETTGSFALRHLQPTICNLKSELTSPLTFEPIFMERIWGGRRLEDEFGKKLPPNKRIGESWEIVDRPEAQSVVANGPLKGKTLHELWMQDRQWSRREPSDIDGRADRPSERERASQSLFGAIPDAPRFPLLVKLLDAQEKLSLQVHPSKKIAAKLGGEPKTEFWYVAAADSGAELFLGFREEVARNQFEEALRKGTPADHLHTIGAKAGDAAFLPAGRLHAIGGGNLLVEIQQNSDTTYRVFDWNRRDDSDKPRQLHVDHALQCIDFSDVAPQLVKPEGDLLVRHELFEIHKWNLDTSREIAPRGQFAIVCCLTGSLRCGDVDLRPAEFCLIPAALQDRQLHPRAEGTTLLRVTIPN